MQIGLQPSQVPFVFREDEAKYCSPLITAEFTESYQAVPSHTKCHRVSPSLTYPTESKQISPNLTESHQALPSLTVSHRV